jgi:hypothetical protein
MRARINIQMQGLYDFHLVCGEVMNKKKDYFILQLLAATARFFAAA